MAPTPTPASPASPAWTTAKRRRAQFLRSQARHVSWLIQTFQSTSHHSFGPHGMEETRVHQSTDVSVKNAGTEETRVRPDTDVSFKNAGREKKRVHLTIDVSFKNDGSEKVIVHPTIDVSFKNAGCEEKHVHPTIDVSSTNAGSENLIVHPTIVPSHCSDEQHVHPKIDAHSPATHGDPFDSFSRYVQDELRKLHSFQSNYATERDVFRDELHKVKQGMCEIEESLDNAIANLSSSIDQVAVDLIDSERQMRERAHATFKQLFLEWISDRDLLSSNSPGS